MLTRLTAHFCRISLSVSIPTRETTQGFNFQKPSQNPSGDRIKTHIIHSTEGTSKERRGPPMAAKTQQSNKSNKRKQITGPHSKSDTSPSKKPKLLQSKSSNPGNKGLNKPFKSFKQQRPVKSHSGKLETAGANEGPKSKRERRLHAKVDSLFCSDWVYM